MIYFKAIRLVIEGAHMTIQNIRMKLYAEYLNKNNFVLRNQNDLLWQKIKKKKKRNKIGFRTLGSSKGKLYKHVTYLNITSVRHIFSLEPKTYTFF